MAFNMFRREYGIGGAIGIALILINDLLGELGLPSNEFVAGLAIVAVAGTVGYYRKRRLEQSNVVDERIDRIRRRGATLAFKSETIAIVLLMVILTFSDYPLPVVPALLVILVGAVLMYELSIEYHRRQM